MVYKNKDLKKIKYNYKKLIFSVLLIIYLIGLCTGCCFALKNADNFSFVQKVTFTEKMIKSGNNSIFSLCRDILLITAVIVLKYSGILKGLCAVVPFIMSVQNSSLYTVRLCSEKTGFFSLLFNVILKDTAVSFLILIYCYITVNDIISGRQSPKNDMKKRIIYITGIILIYIIDFAIKGFILPLQ